MNKSDTTTNVIASMRELLDRLHSELDGLALIVTPPAAPPAPTRSRMSAFQLHELLVAGAKARATQRPRRS